MTDNETQNAADRMAYKAKRRAVGQAENKQRDALLRAEKAEEARNAPDWQHHTAEASKWLSEAKRLRELPESDFGQEAQ